MIARVLLLIFVASMAAVIGVVLLTGNVSNATGTEYTLCRWVAGPLLTINGAVLLFAVGHYIREKGWRR